MSNNSLNEYGLVHSVKLLLELRQETKAVHERMKKAEKDYADHLTSIENVKHRLALHLQDQAGRAEVVLFDEWAAYVGRFEKAPGVWETNVEFFKPRKI